MPSSIVQDEELDLSQGHLPTFEPAKQTHLLILLDFEPHKTICVETSLPPEEQKDLAFSLYKIGMCSYALMLDIEQSVLIHHFNVDPKIKLVKKKTRLCLLT